ANTLRFWLANFPRFLSECVQATVLPIRQSAYHVFRDSTGWPSIAAGWAALIAIGVVLIVLRRRRGMLLFCAGWFVCFLLPLLPGKPNQPDVVAERYLYLPSVAVTLGLAGLGAALWRARPARILVATALGAVLVAGSMRTITRAEVWRNEETLYQTTLVDEP